MKSLSSPPGACDPAAEVSSPEPGRTSARAGRPTAERVQEINRAILDAARLLFLAQGFDITSMEMVAISAEVSKGTLYARYPTKSALLRAVVDDLLERWQTQADQSRGPMPQDFKDRLHHIARSIVESMGSAELRAFQRVASISHESGEELIRLLYEVGHQVAVARLAAEIERGTSRYPAPPRNPVRVAEMMMAMLTGWYENHRRIREVSTQEALAYADHAVDVIFAARAAW